MDAPVFLVFYKYFFWLAFGKLRKNDIFVRVKEVFYNP